MFLAVIVNAGRGEPKRSTFLSFDIKKKVKHHKHDNNTRTTPAPPHKNPEEEMEFTLRVSDFNYC